MQGLSLTPIHVEYYETIRINKGKKENDKIKITTYLRASTNQGIKHDAQEYNLNIVMIYCHL